jgi:hypothetical protein
MFPRDLKVLLPHKTLCITSWGRHPWAPRELGSPCSLTHHLWGDDELGNLGTPTPKELTSNDLRELYMVASWTTNKLCSLGTWLVPCDFDHLGNVSLHLPKDLILALPQGDALLSSSETSNFRDLLFKLCFLLVLDHPALYLRQLLLITGIDSYAGSF